MENFQILITTCSSDVSSCCSDYGIAMFLYIMKQALLLIQIAVPTILVVMAIVQLIKMMISPDDKKSVKSLYNKFIAAVFVFFTPLMVNVVLSILPDGFEVAACWESAEAIAEAMKNEPRHTVSHTSTKKQTVNLENYRIVTEVDNEETESTKGNAKNNKSKSNKKVDTSKTAGQKIVDYAQNFVGNKYVSGGDSLTDGCDCSHFVYLVLKDVGAYKGAYTTSNNWAKLGKEVKGVAKAQAGDVFVYNGHVGIYDGKGHLIEARSPKLGITNNGGVNKPDKKLIAIRRFV